MINDDLLGSNKKKEKGMSKVTLIIYLLFVVSTVIAIFTAYKDIDHAFVFYYLIGYALFLIFFFCYFTVAMFLSTRQLKRADIGRKLVKVLMYFVLLSAVNYVLNYGFKLEKIDYYKVFSVPIGVSIGLFYYEMIVLRREKGKSAVHDVDSRVL